MALADSGRCNCRVRRGRRLAFWNCPGKITPEKLFWMAGFAARTKPAEGTLDDLWAKVLVLEDQGGELCVLVTADLLGVPKWLYDDLCSGL
ncbi:MAG: hypothetical protein GX456_07290 [Verrucomicrobia bacterium]|nr:hypothetical protein [Verrucomicrobiota bacterium]